jgi:hypothetical protein
MKNIFIPTALVAMVGFSSLTGQQTTKAKITDHKEYTIKEDLWDTKIEAFQEQQSSLQFEWQTASKESLRSVVPIALFGVKSGETLVKSKDGLVSDVTVYVFNRGDQGNVAAQEIIDRFKSLKSSLDEATGKSHKDASTKQGKITLTSFLWKTEKSAYSLEMSSSEGRGEFLRFHARSANDAAKGDKMVSRSNLKSNVKRDDNGDVYIEGIPMVDQGQKGYCACASAARVFNYYGRDISQHEVAQMAEATAGGGTRIDVMVDSFKKAAGKLNFRVLVLYEYPKYISELNLTQAQLKSTYSESASDIDKYQALAKKLEGKMLNIDGKEGGKTKSGYMYDIISAQRGMDPTIYKEMMVKKPNYSRFTSSVKKYIDEGVPVAWALQLGMFKEEGLPQIGGGHMRLIIGYNDDKETLIYTDSWGSGHEKKSMPMAEAYCMTNVLLALPPSR